MTQQIQYMLMFSLGPVQSLILQARKTRDLWLGSFLLSKLMEAAMGGIDKSAFVFPAERRIQGYIPDLPNKYIAIFNSRETAEAAAHNSEREIKATWDKICVEVRDNLIKKHYTSEVQKTWERQTNVRQFFEFFWVVVEGSQAGYPKWVKDTILALDARKRLRDFLPQDEPGEKSTVSGEREALHGKGTSRREVQAFWRELTAPDHVSRKDISKDGSERLDAIDTIKRFALYSPTLKPELDRLDFPSTSSIAAAPFIEKLLGNVITDAQLKTWDQVTSVELVDKYPNDIPYLKERAGKREWILYRDGDLYFPEAFTPRYLKENYRITFNPDEKAQERNLTLKDKAFIPGCLDALEDLLKIVGCRPTPYYALVQMDGDNMGSIINDVPGLEIHKGISQALSNFARKDVPKIVQEAHPGRLIYAGGDDVLAFTPLDGMLEMIDDLQKQYRETVREKVTGPNQEKVTASMGIAIAHHFTPLSVVRRGAIEAEKLAKERYGRNAFVVTLIRHSGEQTRVGCRWHYNTPENSQPIKPIELFKHFYRYFATGVFSPKSIYTLLDEASSLVWLDRSAQSSEIRRVLKRQLDEKNRDHLIDEQRDQLTREQKDHLIDKKIATLAEQVVALASAMDAAIDEKQKKDKKVVVSVELYEDELRYGLIETFGWLLVMAFLAREGLEG